MALPEYPTVTDMFKHYKEECTDDDVAAAILSLAHTLQEVPHDMAGAIENGLGSCNLSVTVSEDS